MSSRLHDLCPPQSSPRLPGHAFRSDDGQGVDGILLGRAVVRTVVETPERHRPSGPYRCVTAPDLPASALPHGNLAEEPDDEDHGSSNDGDARRMVSFKSEENTRGERDYGPSARHVPGPWQVPKEPEDRKGGDRKAGEEQARPPGAQSRGRNLPLGPCPRRRGPGPSRPENDPSEDGDEPFVRRQGA